MAGTSLHRQLPSCLQYWDRMVLDHNTEADTRRIFHPSDIFWRPPIEPGQRRIHHRVCKNQSA